MSKTARIQPGDPAPVAGSDAGRDAITVVGIGSEFRGDDAVGLEILRELKRHLPAGVRTIELTGDQSYLPELMRSTDAMIVVDAVQASAPAGTVFRIDASKDPVPEDFVSFSTHAFDSASSIELARTLGSLPGIMLIYGIVGKDFSLGHGVTAEVEEAIDIACTRIAREVGDILSRGKERRARSRAKK